MQTNRDASQMGENNTSSLDNIIRSYEGEQAEKKKQDSGSEKIEELKKKFDDIFKDKENDLAWLDSILNDIEAPSAQEETDDGEGEEKDVTITPENDIQTAESMVEEAVEEAASEEISAVEEAENAEVDEKLEEDDVKIFESPKKEAVDDSISFEMFEDPESKVVSSEEAEDIEEKNVDEYLGTLFGLSEPVKEEPVKEKEKTRKKEKKERKESKKIASGLGAISEIDMADKNAVSEGTAKFYTKKLHAMSSLLSCAVFLVISLYIELAPVASLPCIEILTPEMPVVYSMVCLQVMLFSAMFLIESLVDGAKAVLDKRFSPASCALCVTLACTVQAICSAVLGAVSGSEIKLFCSAGSLTLLMLALYNYLRASADDTSFRIASSPSHKFGAFELPKDSREAAPFENRIDKENAKVITVKRGENYDGFVQRNNRRPDNEKKLGLLCAVILVVSLIVGLFMTIAANDVYTGITSAVIIFISSLPINTYLVSALPKHIAATKGRVISSALIGQNASEEYKGLSVVAFEDTEVFLPKDVRVSSIKTYADVALDEAVVLMSRIYTKVGGPLSKIFAKMIDVEIDTEKVELLRVYPDAIEVSVDGRSVTLAVASFLNANGIRVISDSVDAAFEQSHGSILFMVRDGRIISKFYIKYSVNPNFEKTLIELQDANLCVGINSIDPCVNNDLVFGCLEKANYALCVIKGESAKDIPTVCEKVSSGVIALGSVHNFLEMLILCERTGRNVKINNIIKLISAALGIVLSVSLVLTNSALNVIFCIILQLFWLIPVSVISYLNK